MYPFMYNYIDTIVFIHLCASCIIRCGSCMNDFCNDNLKIINWISKDIFNITIKRQTQNPILDSPIQTCFSLSTPACFRFAWFWRVYFRTKTSRHISHWNARTKLRCFSRTCRFLFVRAENRLPQISQLKTFGVVCSNGTG